MEPLLNCPFCGSDNVSMHEWKPDAVFSGFSVWCGGCGAKSGEFDEKNEAAEYWNDRHRSWDLLMEWLDEIYPADIFDGSSGDIAPQILVKIREINELRKEVER